MAEYINREKTKRELSEWCISLNSPHLLSRDDTMFLLDNIPASDVAPVVHGRWEEKGYVCGESEFECSVCHKTEWRTSISRFRWCPFCGARMDGDDDALD